MYAGQSDFLKSLLPLFVGIKWMKHKNYILEKINYLRQKIVNEQIKEILRGY